MTLLVICALISTAFSLTWTQHISAVASSANRLTIERMGVSATGTVAVVLCILATALSREIVFPAISAIDAYQRPLVNSPDHIDITTGSQFSGLTTFAHLQYVNCFVDGPASEKYDIAVLGAPFDTVSVHSEYPLYEYMSASILCMCDFGGAVLLSS